ncbi:zinc finger protein 202-like [Topomyia yanbarensis]|uniref:zinc finger protein 202-like n=1 Tax=Topomyia yanbarensis TaxID=2498891 RepID=UPI00273AEA67|nr:zinc finger protein 202-like [Topomyia yanbarensis]
MSCCIRGCLSRYGKGKVSFHRIPQNNDERRQRWIEIVDRGDEINYNSAMVCNRHFVGGWPAKAVDKHAINWVPTLFLTQSDSAGGSGTEASSTANAPVLEVDDDSSDIRCVVRGCGMTKEENPSLSFFPIPHDTEERSNWLRRIGMHDKPPPNNGNQVLAVCELHFELSKDLLNYDDVISMGRTAVLREKVMPTRNIPLVFGTQPGRFSDGANEPTDDTPGENNTNNDDGSLLLEMLPREESNNEMLQPEMLAQYPDHLQTSPVEEFVQICRSCMSTDKSVLVSAFEDNLADIFYQFTSIAIDESVGISTSFCTDCKTRLLEMHFFRDTCVTSTQMLLHRYQKYYGGENPEQEPADDDLLEPMHQEDASVEQTNGFVNELVPDDPEDLLVPQKEVPERTAVSKRGRTRTKAIEPPKQKLTAPESSRPMIKKRFKCKVCRKDYNSKTGIEMHMATHANDDPSEFTVECVRCHRLRRPGDKHNCFVDTLYCHVCGEKFRNWSYLKLHLAKMHRIKTKRRELMQKLALDRQASGNTSKLLKSPPKNPTPKKEEEPTLLEASSDGETKDSPTPHTMVKCTFCSASFKYPLSLEAHMRKHSAIHQTQCHECGESFATYRKLEKHFDKHPNEVQGAMYKCAICANIYNRRQTLLMHRQYVHRDREVVQCGGCSKLYAQARQLAEHQCSSSKPTPPAEVNGDFVIVQPESILKGAATVAIEDENSVPAQVAEEGNIDPLLGLGNEEVIELESDDEPATPQEPQSYDCSVCGKTFEKMDVLDRHMKLHRMMNAAKANAIGYWK